MRKAGGVKIVYIDRPVVQEKIVTKTVESTEQIKSLQRNLAAAPITKKSAPSAYHMATNATVYSMPNGTKVDTWESGRSFTSGTSRDGWVKITGYFVNRVWQAASEELWVKESDVIKR